MGEQDYTDSGAKADISWGDNSNSGPGSNIAPTTSSQTRASIQFGDLPDCGDYKQGESQLTTKERLGMLGLISRAVGDEVHDDSVLRTARHACKVLMSRRHWEVGMPDEDDEDATPLLLRRLKNTFESDAVFSDCETEKALIDCLDSAYKGEELQGNE